MPLPRLGRLSWTGVYERSLGRVQTTSWETARTEILKELEPGMRFDRPANTRTEFRGATFGRSMDARRRQQNERKYGTWHELPGGGRLYSYDVRGRSGWRATYVKEVDAEELTVKFYQEVYDAAGTLREVHHKYPVDFGHQQVTGDEP